MVDDVGDLGEYLEVGGVVGDVLVDFGGVFWWGFGGVVFVFVEGRGYLVDG